MYFNANTQLNILRATFWPQDELENEHVRLLNKKIKIKKKKKSGGSAKDRYALNRAPDDLDDKSQTDASSMMTDDGKIYSGYYCH